MHEHFGLFLIISTLLLWFFFFTREIKQSMMLLIVLIGRQQFLIINHSLMLRFSEKFQRLCLFHDQNDTWKTLNIQWHLKEEYVTLTYLCVWIYIYAYDIAVHIVNTYTWLYIWIFTFLLRLYLSKNNFFYTWNTTSKRPV